MDETLALINQIIEEHKLIKRGVRALEKAANDAETLVALENAKEQFMPGRFDQKHGLKNMQESLGTLEERLKIHFEREEKALLNAFEKSGNRALVSALRSLLLEHEVVRNRFEQIRKHLADLTGVGMSRHVWEATAHDMRAYVTHTRKLLEAHAEGEMELLHSLRNELRQAMKE